LNQYTHRKISVHAHHWKPVWLVISSAPKFLTVQLFLLRRTGRTAARFTGNLLKHWEQEGKFTTDVEVVQALSFFQLTVLAMMFSSISYSKLLIHTFGSIILVLAIAVCSFSQTVYVTKTGSKYHANGCQYLSKSKIALQADTAVARGYTTCSVCKPAAFSRATQHVSHAEAQQETSTRSSQCSARTKAGNRCSRMTIESHGRCWQHQ
jgi:hypothetical protein